MNLIREVGFSSMYRSKTSSLRFLRQRVLPAIVLDIGTPYFYVSTLDCREGFTTMYVVNDRVSIVFRGATSAIPEEYLP